jgi:peptidoglycan biosynthesis protein MviN/MurJ (putative lipid II flippase)
MLLAGFAKMTFNDFFIVRGRPGIFFAVQIGAGVSALVLLYLFRRYDNKLPALQKENFISIVPSLFVVLLVAALVAGSSLKH